MLSCKDTGITACSIYTGNLVVVDVRGTGSSNSLKHKNLKIVFMLFAVLQIVF
jgi:hypothetical protein